MGLFSTTHAQLECGGCGWVGEVEVQFKYGNLYNHDYRVGDAIVWGRSQIGDESERKVAAEGIAGCPQCHREVLFDIIIENGKLREAIAATGSYDYLHGEGHYVILED